MPRGATPSPRSGAEAGRTPCPKGGGQEELPHVRGRGWGEAAKRRYPASAVRGSNERSYPTSEVRGGGPEELPHTPKPEARGGGGEEQPRPEARGDGQEDQPHVQGAVAEWVQEGLEELSHFEGQEGWQ